MEPWNFMTYHILGSGHHPNWRSHSIIFQRGRAQPPTRSLQIIINHILTIYITIYSPEIRWGIDLLGVLWTKTHENNPQNSEVHPIFCHKLQRARLCRPQNSARSAFAAAQGKLRSGEKRSAWMFGGFWAAQMMIFAGNHGCFMMFLRDLSTTSEDLATMNYCFHHQNQEFCAGHMWNNVMIEPTDSGFFKRSMGFFGEVHGCHWRHHQWFTYGPDGEEPKIILF